MAGAQPRSILLANGSEVVIRAMRAAAGMGRLCPRAAALRTLDEKFSMRAARDLLAELRAGMPPLRPQDLRG